ncbi:hypothetical protein [Serratia fonticola]|jgi:hypothetical protein|uniref:hypothetical protein n=1 Tax=Serratia fonticola TaxID=47917 RepID=UPI001AEB45EC|nr:hypothetical protein [Serratia fonticola]MBP0995699.1 hypothetical protein [Serratia fonticola]MBP0995706.1 hypothetical protein [Serratia fonticola]MBP1000876.1 hypothetical protein [Serratia fonticola]MBP1000883.1 hypothetical protein [Serratia fonticola]MBP1010560.1 hypothetical protein [Serratia fonticola]
MVNIEKIELEREEVNALIKAVLYLKFDCEDTDSLLYASSPLINSALDKMISMYGYKDDWEKVFAKLPDRNKKLAINKIESSEKEDGIELEVGVKDEVLTQYLHPYKV